MGLEKLLMNLPVQTAMALFAGLDQNRMNNESRQNNVDSAASQLGMNYFIGGGGGAQNSFKIPGTDQTFSLPYDPTQGILDIGNDIGGRMRSDNAAARGNYVAYQNDMLRRSGGLTGALSAESAALPGDYERRGNAVIGGLQDRYARNMNYLNGAGAQEAKDIEQRYKSANASSLQDLTSRGLANSTVLGSMQTGNTREMVNDLGRLQERLRGQRLATDSTLSGDVLSAQSGLNQGILGARGSDLSFRTGLQQNDLGLRQGLGSGYLDLVNQGNSNLTNLYNNLAQQRFNVGMGADAASGQTLSGANFTYPDNSYLQVLQAMGQGLGGYQAYNAQMNMLKSQQHQQWNPLNMFHGSAGYNTSGGFTGGLGAGF